jgi:hypothetical protein
MVHPGAWSGCAQRAAALTPCRGEDVALVAHGLDVLRVLGIGFDLLAQPQDAEVDAAIERVPVALLAEVQDAFARKRLVRDARRTPSAVELERRHRHFLPGCR